MPVQVHPQRNATKRHQQPAGLSHMMSISRELSHGKHRVIISKHQQKNIARETNQFLLLCSSPFGACDASALARCLHWAGIHIDQLGTLCDSITSAQQTKPSRNIHSRRQCQLPGTIAMRQQQQQLVGRFVQLRVQNAGVTHTQARCFSSGCRCEPIALSSHLHIRVDCVVWISN